MRLVAIREGSIKVQREKGKKMGNRNITPIVALRHHQNILIAIDVIPGISVIDIIVVCIWNRRMNTTKLDGGSMDACSSGMSVTRPMESPSRRGRGEPVCQWRGYHAD